MAAKDDFHAHLADGLGTVCRAWAVTRRDGVVMGFTDHDQDLTFEGITFKADTGLSAKALQQATGLSVDNTEAMGALSHASITEADIAAGRYDGAEVLSWLVNWEDVSARRVMFRGFIGEMRRGNGAFTAELRGLTELLNRPLGRVYQRRDTAVLGDVENRFDLNTPGYFHEGAVAEIDAGRVFTFDDLSAFQSGWFRHGRLIVQSGNGAGLIGSIKRDRDLEDGRRALDIWVPMRADIQPGDQIRLEAGYDKRFETAQTKFDNVLNFQGFPDLVEEDWITVYPSKSGATTGGSRR